MKGQVLATFRSFSLSLLGRVVSVLCVTLVLSYIFFEVLDLDGSNFRTHRDPMQITAVVREVETDSIRSQIVHWAKPWIEVSFFLLAKPIQWVHRFSTEESVLPIIYLLHHCGYRTALPRSSIPDDSRLSAQGLCSRTSSVRESPADTALSLLQQKPAVSLVMRIVAHGRGIVDPSPLYVLSGSFSADSYHCALSMSDTVRRKTTDELKA